MRHPRKTLTLALGLGIALATVLGTASSAQAQYAPGYYPPPPQAPPPRGVYRGGLVWGFAFGVGGLSMPDCGQVCGAVGMGEFHIGGMIAPRLAVMGDFWEAGRYYSGDPSVGSGEIYNGIYTAALQLWVNDIIWIKGGLGLGHVQVSSGDSYYGYGVFDDETGFALMVAGGVEIVQAYNFALDLQIRYGNVVYSSRSSGGNGDANQFGLMIGFNWY